MKSESVKVWGHTMKAIRKIAKEKQWKFPVVINEGIKLLKARENIE